MSRSHRRAPPGASGARSKTSRAASETRPASPAGDAATASASWLAGLAASDLARMLALGVDVCMLVDASGVVRACHGADEDPLVHALADGCGHPLLDLVERASRSAVRRLLAAARAGRHSLRHRIQHRVATGNVVAMTYRSLGVGTHGDVAMLGHRVDAPMAHSRPARSAPHTASAERVYAELFAANTAPYVLLDVGDGRVLDANAAARAWLRLGSGVIERAFPEMFAARHRVALAAWLARDDGPPLQLRDAGRAIELRVFARGGAHSTLRVIEMRRADADSAVVAPTVHDSAPLVYSEDAVALCDEDGTLRWANAAFLDTIARTSLAAARDRPLAAVVPSLGPAVAALVRGTMPPLRSVALADGLRAELSAIRLSDADGPTIVLVLRAGASAAAGPFTSAADLAALIGTAPLKSMVRDSAEQVERLCIESTLKLTGNNRSLAARVLGMSRQGLYLKLHQYGLLDDEEGRGEAAPRDRDETGG